MRRIQCNFSLSYELVFWPQVGAIYIWTYVYYVMSLYLNKSVSDDGTNKDSRIHIISSGESSTNIFLESSRKPLLHSNDRRSPDDSQIQAETRSTKSRVTKKDFPS